MMTLTPAPASPSSPGCRRRLSTIATAASPRYASGFPPPVTEGARHGPVGDPESVQQVRVLTEQHHAALHPFGGNPRVVKQLLGRIPPVALPRISGHLLPAGLDPFAVLHHEGTERLLRRGSVLQPAQCIHRPLDAGYIRRHRLLNFSRPDPRRADRPALVVDEIPLGRPAMPGGVLRRIGVVEIRDPIVPLAGVRPAQVRPRHEALVAAHLDLGLEGVGAVGLGLVRRAPVDEKAGHGTRVGGQLRPGQSRRVERAFCDVKLQTARVGHVAHDRPCIATEGDRQCCLAG